MRAICANCGCVVSETVNLPDGWVISRMSLETDKKEDGTNPLGPHTVRAFCSAKCEKSMQTKYYNENLFAKK